MKSLLLYALFSFIPVVAFADTGVRPEEKHEGVTTLPGQITECRGGKCETYPVSQAPWEHPGGVVVFGGGGGAVQIKPEWNYDNDRALGSVLNKAISACAKTYRTQHADYFANHDFANHNTLYAHVVSSFEPGKPVVDTRFYLQKFETIPQPLYPLDCSQEVNAAANTWYAASAKNFQGTSDQGFSVMILNDESAKGRTVVDYERNTFFSTHSNVVDMQVVNIPSTAGRLEIFPVTLQFKNNSTTPLDLDLDCGDETLPSGFSIHSSIIIPVGLRYECSGPQTIHRFSVPPGGQPFAMNVNLQVAKDAPLGETHFDIKLNNVIKKVSGDMSITIVASKAPKALF